MMATDSWVAASLNCEKTVLPERARYILGTMRNDVSWHLLWVTIAAILIGYASFLLFGSFIEKEVRKEQHTALAIDRIGVGTHHISGRVTVPTSCHGLSVRTRQMTQTSYRLDFSTWQQPNRECAHEPFSHPFHVVTFAPSVGVEFTATLDGEMLPMRILKTYQ